MPKFLFQASYTSAGMEGVRSKGGSSRQAAVEETVKSLGGTLESFYFGFGDHDAHVVVDLPDNEAAAAVTLVVTGTGAVAVKTTVLLTPQQVDEAAERSVAYTPPG